MASDRDTPHTCPVCGHAVRVVGSDEGTQHYDPVEPDAGPEDRTSRWEDESREQYRLRIAAERRIADLTAAGRAVIACGVGNLSGEKYRRRVEAFDALDDVLRAASPTVSAERTADTWS